MWKPYFPTPTVHLVFHEAVAMKYNVQSMAIATLLFHWVPIIVGYCLPCSIRGVQMSYVLQGWQYATLL